jgi:hypothetical protein
VRKKEGKVESLTLSDGQYYSENIFPQNKELAAEMAQIPLLSMLVPKRVFVHKNKIYIDIYFKEDLQGPGIPGPLVTNHTLAGTSYVSSEDFPSSITYFVLNLYIFLAVNSVNQKFI